jgi:hypothetical protein
MCAECVFRGDLGRGVDEASISRDPHCGLVGFPTQARKAEMSEVGSEASLENFVSGKSSGLGGTGVPTVGSACCLWLVLPLSLDKSGCFVRFNKSNLQPSSATWLQK